MYSGGNLLRHHGNKLAAVAPPSAEDKRADVRAEFYSATGTEAGEAGTQVAPGWTSAEDRGVLR